GTVASATTQINTLLTGINAIYENELSVRFILIGTNNSIVYTNFATDPYDPYDPNYPNDPRYSNPYRTNQAQTNITNVIGSANFDIGHVLHVVGAYGFSGVAGPDVCLDDFKASGWTGIGTAYGMQPNVAVICHEIGHQFSALHTYNGADGGNCSNNISASSAYEIGSGSTIMAYAGICGVASQNIQFPADLYFHTRSLTQITTSIALDNCPVRISTGNIPPVVNANPSGASISIPKSTPFSLNGTGVDANGDNITYAWEQYDEDGAGSPTSGYIGATAGASPVAPLFRSYPPVSSTTRVFPSLTYILTNTTYDFEPLPSVARTLNFRLTGRDNRAGGGGIHCSSIALTVTGDGPLVVTSPNTAVTLAAGSNQVITWNVNNTSVLCNSMNIYLSLDGGFSYLHTLATNTANDGSESVVIPANILSSTTARIKVESNCNAWVKFFDISNVNFIISSTCISPHSEILPSNPVSFQYADGGLSLGLSNNFGNIVTSVSGTITTSDTDGNLMFLDGTPSVCAGPSNANKYDTIYFSVDITGQYTINHGGIFGTVINLYESNYIESNCLFHMNSSATRPSGTGGVSLGSGITANLTAYTSYYLIVSSFSNSLPSTPFSYNITFPTKPSGANIYNGVTLPINYSYTYIAVNNSSGLITLVNNLSNFTTLSGGDYNIYGVSYYSGVGPSPTTVNPVDWLNTLFASVQISNSCHVFSSNFKHVTVTCPPEVFSNLDSGVGSLRAALNCSQSGGTLNFAEGINPTLTSPLLIDKDIILDGNVNGMNNPSTSILLNFAGSYGTKVNPGITVTLKDMIVHQSGTALPVVLNEGNLTLDNAEIRGNVTPIVQNEAASTTTIKNKVVVKKM
ncbi:MAG: reprolysin-like metallopeptidase, partial [Saprospiraceae bacterium]